MIHRFQLGSPFFHCSLFLFAVHCSAVHCYTVHCYCSLSIHLTTVHRYCFVVHSCIAFHLFHCSLLLLRCPHFALFTVIVLLFTFPLFTVIILLLCHFLMLLRMAGAQGRSKGGSEGTRRRDCSLPVSWGR